MATIKLMLNKARRLNDGTYPLVIQIIHRRKKRVVYLGVYLYPMEFNEPAGEIIPCSKHYRKPKDIREKNRAISEFKQRIENIIARLEREGKPYTCDEIINLYRIGGENSFLLTTYWQSKIAQYREMGRFGIADAQQNTLQSVIRFAGSVYIGITDVTPEFVRRYERCQLAGGLMDNTVAYYMRNFKTIMSCIVRDGLIDKNISVLFEGIKTSPRKTVKRAITREELRALAQMTFDNEPVLELSRDLFMFSFYTQGMPFVDIVYLRQENLSKDFIHYARKKTGQHLQISLNQSICTLISKYRGVSHYLFPVVTSNDSARAYKEYRSSLRRVNKALKIVAKRLGLNTPLTTYVARHSWATQAKEHGFPVSVISEGLGHNSEIITQIYLKEFDHKVLAEANNMIAEL